MPAPHLILLGRQGQRLSALLLKHNLTARDIIADDDAGKMVDLFAKALRRESEMDRMVILAYEEGIGNDVLGPCSHLAEAHALPKLIPVGVLRNLLNIAPESSDPGTAIKYASLVIRMDEITREHEMALAGAEAESQVLRQKIDEFQGSLEAAVREGMEEHARRMDLRRKAEQLKTECAKRSAKWRAFKDWLGMYETFSVVRSKLEELGLDGDDVLDCELEDERATPPTALPRVHRHRLMAEGYNSLC
uniref:Uncharacterized protein n=1 Tax=Mycena chlorophos TaxID=658473 RepID=A0ABQ0LYX6_MYCCL|nr:predicted protein [Mycena chlorophos]